MAKKKYHIKVTLETPEGETISEREAQNVMTLSESNDEANQKLGYTLMKSLLTKFPAGTYSLYFDGRQKGSIFKLLLKTRLHTLEVVAQPKLLPFPEAFEQIKGLKGLVFRRMQVTNLPKAIYTFQDLEVLDVSDNFWDSGDRYYPTEYHLALDKRLTKFPKLKKLDLSGNKYAPKDLPQGLEELTQLEFLGLSGNRLKKIPEVVFQFPKLKTLLISDAWLSVGEQPKIYRQMEQLVTLPNLEYLDVSVNYNGITRVPKSWGQLQKLKCLKLNNNGLSELPEELCLLPQLQEIYLENNALLTLPEKFSELPLTNQVLDLSNNRLIHLPQKIGGLKHLKKLNLYGNKLTTLPESIGELTHLESLNVAYNQLERLPAGFANLTKLDRSLSLSTNRLTEFPEVLFSLTQVAELDLSNNLITHIPAEIEAMRNLHFLKMYNNRVENIHENISKLPELNKLHLSHNQLRRVPDSLGNMKNLHFLYLNNNQLQALPANFGKLTKLSPKLNLSYNRLEKLPDSFFELNHLTELDLSGNRLQTLPNQWGKMVKLRELRLNKNHLKALPDSIGQLKSLVKLWVQENQLEVLPESMSALRYLNSLVVWGNPMGDNLPDFPHCKYMTVNGKYRFL
ncbi:MAG TPA: hypothetical protein DCS93_36845 [Microscillaceae bacterium]|nr:hypothetical protein [Microscillaceae bacterium]